MAAGISYCARTAEPSQQGLKQAQVANTRTSTTQHAHQACHAHILYVVLTITNKQMQQPQHAAAQTELIRRAKFPVL